MDLNSVVETLTREDEKTIIEDYEEFQKKGAIGDCLLRKKAELIKSPPHVVRAMEDIVNAIFRRYYVNNNYDGYAQNVLVEFNNQTPYVVRYTSKEPITMHRIIDHFESKDQVNWDRDSVTFLSVYDEDLDNTEKE